MQKKRNIFHDKDIRWPERPKKNSFLLLVVRHLLLQAWQLLLVAMHLLLVASCYMCTKNVEQKWVVDWNSKNQDCLRVLRANATQAKFACFMWTLCCFFGFKPPLLCFLFVFPLVNDAIATKWFPLRVLSFFVSFSTLSWFMNVVFHCLILPWFLCRQVGPEPRRNGANSVFIRATHCLLCRLRALLCFFVKFKHVSFKTRLYILVMWFLNN